MPIVIPVLTKLGIFDAVKREAYLNREGITWRDMNGHCLANLPLADKTTDEFGGVLLLGQVSGNDLTIRVLAGLNVPVDVPGWPSRDIYLPIYEGLAE